MHLGDQVSPPALAGPPLQVAPDPPLARLAQVSRSVLASQSQELLGHQVTPAAQLVLLAQLGLACRYRSPLSVRGLQATHDLPLALHPLWIPGVPSFLERQVFRSATDLPDQEAQAGLAAPSIPVRPGDPTRRYFLAFPWVRSCLADLEFQVSRYQGDPMDRELQAGHSGLVFQGLVSPVTLEVRQVLSDRAFPVVLALLSPPSWVGTLQNTTEEMETQYYQRLQREMFLCLVDARSAQRSQEY